MNTSSEIVYIIDDDSHVRDALSELLSSHGLDCVSFASTEAYLAERKDTEKAACLILDVELPDTNGLEFQRRNPQDYLPPIIFLTGYGDIPSSVRAMKDGAVDFLTKPVDGDVLLAAIASAFERDRMDRELVSELTELRERFGSLSPRESEVFPLVVSGLLNKQAAAELGISEHTLEVHRRRIMRKMVANNFAQLVRMSEKLKGSHRKNNEKKS